MHGSCVCAIREGLTLMWATHEHSKMDTNMLQMVAIILPLPIAKWSHKAN